MLLIASLIQIYTYRVKDLMKNYLKPSKTFKFVLPTETFKTFIYFTKKTSLKHNFLNIQNKILNSTPKSHDVISYYVLRKNICTFVEYM